MLRCQCERFHHNPKTCGRGCALLWAAGLRPQAFRLAAEHNRSDERQMRADLAEYRRDARYREATGRAQVTW